MLTFFPLLLTPLMQSGATRFLEFYSLGLAVASGVSFAVGVELGPVIKGQIGKLEDSKKIGKVDSAEKLVAVAEDIVGESRQSFPAAACMLTTVAGNQPKARMVNPMSVRLGKNPEVIFNTNRNSRKFKQLKENPNATITYLDPAGTNRLFCAFTRTTPGAHQSTIALSAAPTRAGMGYVNITGQAGELPLRRRSSTGTR